MKAFSDKLAALILGAIAIVCIGVIIGVSCEMAAAHHWLPHAAARAEIVASVAFFPVLILTWCVEPPGFTSTAVSLLYAALALFVLIGTWTFILFCAHRFWTRVKPSTRQRN